MSTHLTAHAWFSALLDVAGSQPIGARLRQCPGHKDPSPSLAVKGGADGRVLLRCYAGCDLDRILGAMRCARSRLNRPAPVTPARYAASTGLNIKFPAVELRDGHPSSRGFRLEAIHEYGGGKWLLERWRSRGGEKSLQWETLRNGQRIPGLFGVPLHALPLYREREVGQAIAIGDPVLVVESESSVDAMRGLFGTTWAGGATAVNVRRLRQILGDYPKTVIIPDHDDAGLRVLDQLAYAGLARNVLLGEPGEDARDLYQRLGPYEFDMAVDLAIASTNERSAAA